MLSWRGKMNLLLPAFIVSAAFILALGCTLPPPAAAGPAGREGSRLLVGFVSPPSPAELESLRNKVVSLLPSPSDWEGPELILPRVALLKLPVDLEAERLREILEPLSSTSFVEEDGPVTLFAEPDDPRYTEQWHLPSISAPGAWEITTGSSSVTIAVIDTGVDYNHPDLSSKVIPGYNFIARNTDPMDDHGHGTHVAGLAAAATDNGLGVAGVDWKARIMPLKVLDSQGTGYESDVAAAIRYAVDNGARVINMSLGSPNYSYTLEEACSYAHNRGAVIVAASGNEGSSVSYPAALDHVVAVGALDSNDSLASFSNRGPELDLTAPGVSLLSTFAGGDYAKLSGTSMATPVVAGCAALVLAEHPEYSPDQVESVLEQTATDLGSPGFDQMYGHGKVNIHAALRELAPAPPPPDDGDDDWSPPSRGGEPVWYLAEGYTGPGFDTFILVQNPNDREASLRGEFVNPYGEYRERRFSLPGHSRMTIHLNSLFPGEEISTCISSLNEVGVVVERSMYFDYGGREGGHCTKGSTDISTQWFFAEGYTGPGFDEYILVLNPWFSDNYMELTLYDGEGDPRVFPYWMPAASRLTIHVNQLAPGREVAARIDSFNGVVAERAMYFDYGGRRGGHCTLGCPSPSQDWFFAEGYTGPGFDEWLLLFNPDGVKRTATVTYRLTDGSQVQSNYVVPAFGRRSVHVNREVPDREVAIKVEAGGEGLVAERAMYFLYRGAWEGGHCAPGAVSPGLQWNLAEGYTGYGFETWILIQNASAYETAEIRLACMTNQGIAGLRTYRLAPASRTTLFVNDLFPGGDVSVSLYSANNVPVVVERAMYFDYGGRRGGSVDQASP